MSNRCRHCQANRTSACIEEWQRGCSIWNIYKYKRGKEKAQEDCPLSTKNIKCIAYHQCHYNSKGNRINNKITSNLSQLFMRNIKTSLLGFKNVCHLCSHIHSNCHCTDRYKWQSKPLGNSEILLDLNTKHCILSFPCPINWTWIFCTIINLRIVHFFIFIITSYLKLLSQFLQSVFILIHLI